MRHLSLALAASMACLTVQACSCTKGNGEIDAGSDAGEIDAGPPTCTTQEDCVTKGLPASEYVCDPRGICIPKCTGDSDCKHLIEGVCEPIDGICRPKCSTSPDANYCLALDAGIVCDDDKGICMGRCAQDDDCSALGKPGRRCYETTGTCSASGVHGCNFDSDCNNWPDFDDYCFNGGIQCRCVIESNDAGTQGVCHRRNRPCTECTSAAQCGSAPQFDPQGDCRTVPGDMSGKTYCLFRHNGPCACGYFDNGSGYCAPAQGRTCDNPGCGDDRDCPGGSVCNKTRCACEPRCRWDFQKRDVAAPGCPPGQTCWVDNENLDPDSIYYGAGRCRPPCQTDMDCAFDMTTNPHGGAKLKCAGEKLAGGGTSDKRCRANGDCMDNLECPEQPNDQPYLGYCDRGTFICHDMDCRLGNDPITGKAYGDCRSPYGCKLENGMNRCILKTCIEQGGASRACAIGHYCCGEDKNFNDAGDPCPGVNERDAVGCYRAPSAPFCKACKINCTQGMGCTVTENCDSPLPGWLTAGPDQCTNGSKSPTCAQWPNGSPIPNVCVIYAQEMMGMTQLNHGFCQAATHNDIRVSASGQTRAQAACPAVFSPSWHPYGEQPVPGIMISPQPLMSGDYCDTDADCQIGNDAGRCATTNQVPPKPMMGGPRKACLCNVGSAQQQCPLDPDAGIVTFCRDGPPGSEQICASSVVCDVGNPYIFGDRDAGPIFGCGITPPP